MGRPVSFDFTTGGGSPEEFLMGTVHLEPTLMHTIGNTVVLPDAPYPVKLVNGKAVHPNVAVSPAGPEPAWAYKVTIENELTGKAWSEFRGVPTGTTQIAYKDLTKFVTTIPPQTTAGMMQNWADTTEANAERSELAADRAEAPTDEMNKTLIENPASLTSGALSSAIEGAVGITAGILKGTAAAEFIASRLTFGVGNINVGIASDSTADGTADWPRQWESIIAAQYPHLRVEHNQWVNADGAYGPTVIIQEGTGEPAFSGLVISDTFTRTTNLATPDSGGPWDVFNAGNWILNGSTVRTTGVGYLRVNTGGRDMTSTTIIDLDTSNIAAVQDHRIFQAGIYVQIRIASGVPTAYVYGGGSLVGSVDLTTLGIPASTASAGSITLAMVGEIQNQSVTITGPTSTWSLPFTISEDAYSIADTNFTLYAYSATPGIGISSTTVSVSDRPATYQTLTVWSGTMGGGTLDYQLANWDEMFGYEIAQPGNGAYTEPATLVDTFTHTGILAGTVADTGEAWSTGASASQWSSDGEAAYATGIGVLATALAQSSEARWDVGVTTSTPAEAHTIRLGLKTEGTGVNGIYAALYVNADGTLSTIIYVRTTAGGYRGLGSVNNHGATANNPVEQVVPVKVNLTGLNVTVTVGTGTGTWAITQAELDGLGTHVELQSFTADSSRFRIHAMEADYIKSVPAKDPIPAGVPLDIMVIAHGHNYQTMSPSGFVVKLEEFLDVMTIKRPSAIPLLSSQNPQFAPAANPTAHAARLRAVREYATTKGFTYAPVYEHFARNSDLGVSWVSADGVHPNATGMAEWGRVLNGTVTPPN